MSIKCPPVCLSWCINTLLPIYRVAAIQIKTKIIHIFAENAKKCYKDNYCFRKTNCEIFVKENNGRKPYFLSGKSLFVA